MLFLIEKNNNFVSIEMTTLYKSTFFQRLLHRLLYHYNDDKFGIQAETIFFRRDRSILALSHRCTCYPVVSILKQLHTTKTSYHHAVYGFVMTSTA